MRFINANFRKNEKAVSPAFSTVILTAAVICMILVAMTYANNILNLRMAENEFSTNKQFMFTTGQQIDDIAWTIGRTQTVSYSCKFGNVKFQEMALNYTFRVHTSSGWENLSLSGTTGIILYNMPSSSYSFGNNFFMRLPNNTTDNSFLQSGSSAPVAQIFCNEKVPMNDGCYSRVILAPTMRILTSTQDQTSYCKFYVPALENGTSLYRSQSITLRGNGISRVTRSGVDQVVLTVSYPKASSLGFDSSFFNFKSSTITLNSTSTPRITANSVIEFYIGKIVVTIGQV
ncbi:MAG: hypothetical protein NWE98_02570 [Candidatus Bathyarchaeota archaeon]|nr:hypothetical protein [Candidatus Bathyarchaeota archaeon]